MTDFLKLSDHRGYFSSDIQFLLYRDSIFVPILNCSTSIFAGFVVFSVLGFMSYKTGLPVSSVATGGKSLVLMIFLEVLTIDLIIFQDQDWLSLRIRKPSQCCRSLNSGQFCSFSCYTY